MHALYSNHIGYNETPTLPVLNGPPSWVVRSASKKTADPELDTDSEFTIDWCKFISQKLHTV